MTDSESDLKPRLLDAINYETDIAPHRFISIWAGVGSGKNFLIEKMITGDPEKNIPQLSVLLITSRKSKVLESLRRLGDNVCTTTSDFRNYEDLLYDSPFDPDTFKRIIYDEEDIFELSLYQRSVICTDTFIEAYLKHCHQPDSTASHLWNRFDVIVWDEAHSLYTDSSYRTAPFHVMSLLQKTLSLIKKADRNTSLSPEEQDPTIHVPTCQRIILMTGTPGPLTDHSWVKNSHILDMRQICRNVAPKNFHFLTSSQAQRLINEQLERGERIVYFSNHTLSPDDLLKYQIPRQKIAVSFSKAEKRKGLKDACEAKGAEKATESDYDRMINVENHLAEHCHIREDITLFVTTSKNKEGINIEDEDIRHVYIESHSLTDITQMAGRIRLGAEHAYIILDSKGYRDSEPPYERTFARMCAIPEKSNDNSSASQLNRNLQRFCSQINISDFVGNPTSSIKAYNTVKPELGKFIDHVKNQSEYYQFDYIRNKFFYNVYRESSIDFINDEWRKFYVAKSSDSLLSLFQCTFPHSCLHPILSPEEDATACFLRYLDQHQETQHHVNDLLAIISELAKILGEPKRQKQNSTTRRINHYLHQIGFHADRKGHKPASPTYDLYTITVCTNQETSDAPAA